MAKSDAWEVHEFRITNPNDGEEKFVAVGPGSSVQYGVTVHSSVGGDDFTLNIDESHDGVNSHAARLTQAGVSVAAGPQNRGHLAAPVAQYLRPRYNYTTPPTSIDMSIWITVVR